MSHPDSSKSNARPPSGQSGIAEKRRRRWRMMAWMAAFMVLAAMILPLTGYVYVALLETVQAQDVDENRINPRANYWRAVR
jgi:hypothetical protein